MEPVIVITENSIPSDPTQATVDVAVFELESEAKSFMINRKSSLESEGFQTTNVDHSSIKMINSDSNMLVILDVLEQHHLI